MACSITLIYTLLFIFTLRYYVLSEENLESKKMPNVLLWGGAGQLGSAIVNAFKTHGWTTWSVDFVKSSIAAHTIDLSATESVKNNVIHVLEKLVSEKAEFDAVVCIAGGWVGGSISHLDIFDGYNKMDSMNIQSAIATGHVASKTLKEGGTLVLTGAAAALTPTPGMLAYGISKAATPHIIKSLAQADSGLPKGSTVIGILPVILDTQTNRRDMPTANFNNWTPLETVAGKIISWAEGKDRPENGALVKIVTKDGHTEYTAV